MTDARFEDGGEAPAASGRAGRRGPRGASRRWCRTRSCRSPRCASTRKRRRFALLLNRFRWEDRAAAERRGPRL